MSPAMADLEALGDAYLKALQELVPLLKKAHDYYDQKDYKEDQMADGKKCISPCLRRIPSLARPVRALKQKS
jgi:hypothetical protein